MSDMNDFSRRTIIILLILAITISLFGTWAIFDKINGAENTRAQKIVNDHPSQGKVVLQIVRPENVVPVVNDSSAEIVK